ncbi:MAG: recombinase family protein [Bryobacteraceae bacterium]|nr:recombinase family protein [Bryobacteraceae bacterium]
MRPAHRRRARKDAVYARTAADDEAGTACRDQVRRVLEVLGTPARTAVYGVPGRSGLDADRPALRRLLADVRQGGLRRVVVRDLARLARSAALLVMILRELRAAGVELLTVEGAERHA